MIKYRLFFKSMNLDKGGFEVALADPKLKVDFLGYLNGDTTTGRAYRLAEGGGEIILDYREICAIEVLPG